jgi:hypothetical protein
MFIVRGVPEVWHSFRSAMFVRGRGFEISGAVLFPERVQFAGNIALLKECLILSS